MKLYRIEEWGVSVWSWYKPGKVEDGWHQSGAAVGVKIEHAIGRPLTAYEAMILGVSGEIAA